MSSDTFVTLPESESSQSEKIEQIIERFKVSCKSELRPRIIEFMTDIREPDRSVVLRKLIALESRFVARGARVRAPRIIGASSQGRPN